MRSHLATFFSLALLSTSGALAQTARDFAIDLGASVSEAPPAITLSWTQRRQSNITAQSVSRRLKGGTTWTTLATLGLSDTTYTDNSVATGVEYEYRMLRTYSGISPNSAMGYLSAGIDVPMVEERGTLLLVVDDTMEAPLAPEIAQLQRDLAADGWTVQTITAARTGTAIDTKALIQTAYNADPASVRMVYLLGRVPVPYSGSLAPDGHGNHIGAWPADSYYGDMDGVWTDTSVNNSSSSYSRQWNTPGDGKFDQSTIPSAVDLMVGRVDLSQMTQAPSASVSETTLLRRYLRKAHDFRYKQGAYANIPRRGIIRDGFGYFGGEVFAVTGWAWMFTGIGSAQIDEPPSGGWWQYAAANSYLIGHGNGGGSFTSASSVGTTADFGRRPSKVVFNMLFGSYHGDWDSPNNFMRAPLAGTATGDSLGLCCFWAGRPAWFMFHMGMGETLGYSIRLSMNSQYATSGGPYAPANFPAGGVHLGLMGDPALRLHIVEPPRGLTARSTSGQVDLAWAPSTDTNVLGYHVYRAATTAGPFTRLTTNGPLATPGYTDNSATAGQSYAYMVRTLKLESVPGGTYQNLSQGSMATITANSGGTGGPPGPSGLAVIQTSGVNAQLTWADNSSDESGFRIERTDGPGGSFAMAGIVGANVTTYTDTGPFAQGTPYYYRVIATSAAGDSTPSDEASFEAVAGYFEFDATFTKASKTAGVASIPVKRFGGSTGVVSVNYATSNSSALAGTHYTATSGTLTWADGDTAPKNIDIPLIDSGSPQQPRQFRLTLSSPSSGTGVGVFSSLAVLIEDSTATLSAPWSQAIVGGVTSSSPSVEAENGFSSTTIGGTGLGAAATSESGQFIYQTRTGDGVMTAYIPTPAPAQTAARFAVMVRENATSSGARMAGAVTSGDSSAYGSKLAYRTTTSANSVLTGSANTQGTPRWVRLTRAGNSFMAECSADGSTWTNLGTGTVPMPVTAQWGLFHYSDDWASTSTFTANYQTASFQNVSFGALTAPDEPANFALTQPSTTRVTLNWTAAPSAAGYRLERRTENGSFAQIVDLDAATVTFNDDTVAPNSGYEYRIYAYNATGNSPFSPVLRVTTPAPDVVASLATAGNAASGDASIRASATSTNFGSESVLTVAGLSSTGALSAASKSYLRFDLNGIPTAKAATLRLAVVATRNFEQAGYSFGSYTYIFPDASDAWDESTITWDNAPLNQTTGTGLTGGTYASFFSISDPLGVPAPGSVLGLSVPANTLNTQKGVNGIVTLALFTSSKAAQIDFAAREHPALPPPTLEVTYASPLPARPSFFTATPGTGTNIDLAWSDNSSTETGFQIERRPVGGSFALLQTAAADSTTFTDTATTLGTTYEYRIRANSASGDSAWSLIVSAPAGGAAGTSMGLMSYESWLQSHGYSPSLADNGDLDGDGIANLLEYALGLPVDAATPSGTPIAGIRRIGDDDYLTLTFARRIDAAGIVLVVEATDSPAGPWTTLDPLLPRNQVEAFADLPEVGWQTLVIKDTVPLRESNGRFMRLNVTRQ